MKYIALKLHRGPSITYTYTHIGGKGGGGVKSPIHFHFFLHTIMGEGVQIVCKLAYVLNERPLNMNIAG